MKNNTEEDMKSKISDLCKKTLFVDDKDAAMRFVKHMARAYGLEVRENVCSEWVWDEDGMDWGIGSWKCGSCKSRPQTWWATDRNTNPLRCGGSKYCGDCGAELRGEKDDD